MKTTANIITILSIITGGQLLAAMPSVLGIVEAGECSMISGGKQSACFSGATVADGTKVVLGRGSKATICLSGEGCFLLQGAKEIRVPDEVRKFAKMMSTSSGWMPKATFWEAAMTWKSNMAGISSSTAIAKGYSTILVYPGCKSASFSATQSDMYFRGTAVELPPFHEFVGVILSAEPPEKIVATFSTKASRVNLANKLEAGKGYRLQLREVSTIPGTEIQNDVLRTELMIYTLPQKLDEEWAELRSAIERSNDVNAGVLYVRAAISLGLYREAFLKLKQLARGPVNIDALRKEVLDACPVIESLFQ